MKKSLGVKPYLFPMPVALIATYNEDGSVNVMNAAWVGICSENKIALNLDEEHATSRNIKKRGAFTITVSNAEHMKEADFFGIATANKMKGKFERSGLNVERSELVDAPIINEYPLSLECKVHKIINDGNDFTVIGEIVDVKADESILNEKGDVDIKKLDPIVFDQAGRSYYKIGEKAGRAWHEGVPLMNT